VDRFAEHLDAPAGRGVRPAGAHDGNGRRRCLRMTVEDVVTKPPAYAPICELLVPAIASPELADRAAVRVTAIG